ncbi:MAG: hypothetical protein GX622_05030 [Bacteroidales bacterium]|nr:hypothetical protein [Bacteroidales bacterium]
MERSEKKLAELGKVLVGGKSSDIIERIRLLRMEMPFIGALKMLALFYDRTEDEGIKLTISGLFNDMKEQGAKPEIIDAINAVTDQKSKAMLLSSCWQSGLDYSEHAHSLAGFFMTGDYMTSLECFTVFETCASSVSEADRTSIIARLRQEIDSWDKPMQKLGEELISLLEG